MERREIRTLCECVSKGELTFVINGNQETGLGTVDFVVTQEIIMGETKDGPYAVPSLKTLRGTFYPKDAETSAKLLQQLDTFEIRAISGVFEDRNTGKEGKVTLDGVLFPSIIIGWSNWAFTANSGACPGQ